MASRRGRALVAFVVILTLAQVAFEDALRFLEATGTLGTGITSSPYVLVSVPLVLYIARAGTLLGWSIPASRTHR